MNKKNIIILTFVVLLFIMIGAIQFFRKDNIKNTTNIDKGGSNIQSNGNDNTEIVPEVVNDETEENTSTNGSMNTVYKIVSMIPVKSDYQITIQSTTRYGGDLAIKKAMEETGCDKDHIFDGNCAPSLNNGFYISKIFSEKQTYIISENTEVSLVQGGVPEQSTTEQLYTFFTKNVDKEYWTPFIIDINETVITRISEQYIP